MEGHKANKAFESWWQVEGEDGVERNSRHKHQSRSTTLGSFNSPLSHTYKKSTDLKRAQISLAAISSLLLLLKLLGHQANLTLIVNHRSSSTLALWTFLFPSSVQSAKPLTADSCQRGHWSFSGRRSGYPGITLCDRATKDRFTEGKKKKRYNSGFGFVEMDCSAPGSRRRSFTV